MFFCSVNPTTEEEEARFPAATDPEVDETLARADRAWPVWAATPLAERAAALRRVAGRLRAKSEELSILAAREMGKPIGEGRGEVEKCAWTLEVVAEKGAEYFAPVDAPTDAARSYVRFDPLGPILAVMPWNFPYWQVIRFGAAALLAGNGIVIKHAPNVPRCALALESAFREAELPEGLVQNLFLAVDPPEAFARVIASPTIRAVTLTGSERAGRAVAALAGQHLKPAVLELGGSDPFVVLDDADVPAVAAAAVRARAQNNGQSCIAAKRFLVMESIADRFVEAFAAGLAALRVGDPLDESTQIGPLARADLRDALEAQCRRAVDAGARLVVGATRDVNGGTRTATRGWFFRPTLLDHCRPGMAAMDEETFGPLGAVARVRDEEEAISVANASRYGLGASIWTADPARGERLAARIEAGSVFVNGMVKSDPRLPFGGIKCSGYGRELSVFGARELVNRKTVWVG
ncbi:MAG: NAD-dependent succinate-semialdehyde dehydrogenase [Candidatus Eisenbacteria bacterium]